MKIGKKYDNWCIDRSLCNKSTKIGTNNLYHILSVQGLKYPLSIQDGRYEIHLFDILASGFRK